MFRQSQNSRSYTGGQLSDIEHNLRGLLNQVTRGSFSGNSDRRILICPLSDDIFSYKLSDNLARTAAANGSSVLLWIYAQPTMRQEMERSFVTWIR